MRSLFSRKWTSSTRRRSISRYFRRKAAMLPDWMEVTSSLVNCSDETYAMRPPAFSWRSRWPIACMRWVLPSPTPP